MVMLTLLPQHLQGAVSTWHHGYFLMPLVMIIPATLQNGNLYIIFTTLVVKMLLQAKTGLYTTYTLMPTTQTITACCSMKISTRAFHLTPIIVLHQTTVYLITIYLREVTWLPQFLAQN